MLKHNEPLVVVYHGGACRDGFCSAYLASRAFPDAEFIPASYGDAPPDVRGKQVLIADFSYDAIVLAGMQADCVGDLVILDHHKSAEQKLTDFAAICSNNGLGTPEIIFDLTRSGAMLTWEYLDKNDLFPKWRSNQVPKLVQYVQDRDLWKFELKWSREINDGIRVEPLTFERWEALETAVEYFATTVRDTGIAVRKRNQQIIDSHVSHAAEVVFCDHKIKMVNCTVDLSSEVCEVLAGGQPFAMSYFDRGNGDRVFSLRSAPDGIDVSEIAKQFGGGGHRHAAGFTMKCVSAPLPQPD